MAYSKSAFASQLGIGKKELEQKARNAGFDTTEGYYNSGQWQGGSSSGGNFAAQDAKESDFLKRYGAAISGQESLPSIYERYSTEAGLPQMRETTQRLGQSLYDIPEQVKTSAKQFGMSSSNIAKRITGRLSDITPTYQRAMGQLQSAESGVAGMMGYEAAQQAKELQPFTVEAGMIGDASARAVTGYTTERQGQLDQLLQQMKTQGNLDLASMNNIAALAQQEAKYISERDLWQYQQSNKPQTLSDSGW